jgi:hypothetical protein
MGMPGEPPNSIGRLSRTLNAKYGAKYMIWNLAEVVYDYSAFNEQVLEFKFPVRFPPQSAAPP